MITILGYCAAVLIGISLGLIGGGGSILTVPVLVYLLGFSPVLSTAYSFFIVGLAALVGSISYMRTGLIHYKSVFYFGIPSVISVFIARKYILPAIPSTILNLGGWEISKNACIMILFSILMIAASLTMIRSKAIYKMETLEEENPNYLSMLITNGFLVGILTGLVGIGGGFLIIPALVILARLPMKTAVGTSLFIIALNSLIGFAEDVNLNFDIDWAFLFFFSGFATTGILMGTYFSRFILGTKLKTTFGWFILVMGISIIIKETLKSL